MAVTDEERLVVALEARINDFEKRMAQAERRGTRTYQQLTAGSSRATRQMEQDMIRSSDRINQALAQTGTKIGAFGKAFVGGLAAGAAIGALEGIRQAAIDSTKSVLELSDQAKMAGVSFKAFQQLKIVAEQNRVGVDALTDGLKELSLRADEFIQTGAGSAAEAFQRLGYDSEELARKLKQPDQLFLEIIGRLEKFDKAARIRIADELFGGTGGEKFVQLIDQGEAGLRRQIKAAEDLGLVMDEQMVKKAEEVNQKFQVISNTITTYVKAAIVDAVSAWFRFLDSYNDFQNQQQGTLESRQKEIMGEKNRIAQARQTALDNPNLSDRARTRAVSTFDDQLRKLNEEEDKIIAVMSQRMQRDSNAWTPPTPPPGGFSSSSNGKADLTRFLAPGKDASHISGLSSSFEGKLEKMLADLPKELAGKITINSGYRSNERQTQLWQEALQKYGSVAEARKWVAPPGNSQHNKGNAADLGYGSDAARQWAHDNASKYGLQFPLGNENWHIEDADARGKAMADKTKELEDRGKAYDDMIAKAKEFVASEQLEATAVGMSKEAAARLRYEQDLLNEARSAGIELNPTQIENIKALASEMASAEEATRKLAKSQADAQRASEEFASIGKNIVGGFVQDLINGTSAADAMKSALSRLASSLADRVINNALDQLFKPSSSGTSAGGGLLSWIGSLFKSADGSAFTSGGVRAFAKGGTFSNKIVDSPTLFKFANGTGLMGEAGEEAIMPLKRDASGRLGVAAQLSGGSQKAAGSNVSISVNNYSGQEVETQETTDSRGNRQVTMVIGQQAAAAIKQRGNPARQAIQNDFAVKTRGIAR